jgi:NitT/TauT family transport system substrate-binding protein
MRDDHFGIHRVLSRRDALRGAGAGVGFLLGGGLLAACGGDEQPAGGGVGGGAGRVTQQLGWLKLTQFGGFFAAQEQGYFGQENVQVDIRAGGPNVIASQVVTGGQALMGDDDNGTVLQAIDKGAPLVIYATIFQSSPYSVISLPGNPVRTLAEFEGKKVALSPATRPLLMPLLERENIDADSIEFLPAGPDPSQLVNEQVDAYFGYATQQGVALREQGLDPVVTNLNDLGLSNYGNVLITRRDTLEEQRDLLVRHLRASIRGWEWGIQNPEQLGRLVAEEYGPAGLKVDTEVAVARAQAPLIENDRGVMRITQEKMQLVIDSYRGVLRKPMRAADVMTTELLDAAYGGETSLLRDAAAS